MMQRVGERSVLPEVETIPRVTVFAECGVGEAG